MNRSVFPFYSDPGFCCCPQIQLFPCADRHFRLYLYRFFHCPYFDYMQAVVSLHYQVHLFVTAAPVPFNQLKPSLQKIFQSYVLPQSSCLVSAAVGSCHARTFRFFLRSSQSPSTSYIDWRRSLHPSPSAHTAYIVYIFANILKILLWRVSRFLKNEIILKKFGNPKIISTFAIPIAEIAQLVEHDLAKVGVASSSLVFRSSLKVSFPLTFFHALTFRTALYMMRHRVCGK